MLELNSKLKFIVRARRDLEFYYIANNILAQLELEFSSPTQSEIEIIGNNNVYCLVCVYIERDRILLYDKQRTSSTRVDSSSFTAQLNLRSK